MTRPPTSRSSSYYKHSSFQHTAPHPGQELNERHLTLLEGSAFTEADLQRARAAEAVAVMVVADRFSPEAAQEDTDVQFR